MFELFDHTADLGLFVRAATRESLLLDAADGLRAMILSPAEVLNDQQQRTVTVSATDIEALLFDWLSELLFLFECDHFLAARIHLTIAEPDDALQLDAQLYGEVVDPQSRPLEHEVKAITYHEFRVAHVDLDDGRGAHWEASVIADI